MGPKYKRGAIEVFNKGGNVNILECPVEQGNANFATSGGSLACCCYTLQATNTKLIPIPLNYCLLHTALALL